MKCPRCNNEDPEYFYLGSSGYYCRKCISFRRRLVSDSLADRFYEVKSGSEEVFLAYELSAEQLRVSEECASYCKETDVLLHCVCGAGKTEIVLRSISEALEAGKNVGYAISRRQVVLEIGERLRGIFPAARVVSVCAGYTDEIYGDIIVCTTHQLYRYERMFDLLVLDECDAFPYKGNEVLQNIATNSVRGHIIYSTATVDEYLRKKISGGLVKLELNRRYHGHDLPVPKQVMGPELYLLFRLYRFIRDNENQVMVFLPSRKQCKRFSRMFGKFMDNELMTSDTEDKDLVIRRFRDREVRLIFATTVLERGVTFSGVDVVVMNAESGIFDLASLIQMSGRAGRKAERPDGKVLFLQNARSINADACIREIVRVNGS